jgi:AcrR family transcriptional regulator
MKRTPTTTRPRGRPRSFDEATVLAALLEVFWEKGFSQASLENLETAAGISRPSLYAAFGDKHSMYLRALAAFESRMTARLTPALDPTRPLREGMREFFLRALDIYAGERRVPRGCLVFSTAVVEAPEDAGIRAALAAALECLDRALLARFAAAKSRGDLPGHASAASLAATAAALLHSLALRARAGVARARLLEFIEAGLDALLGADPSARPRRRTGSA